MSRKKYIIIHCVVLLSVLIYLHAQDEQPPAQPPANVVVADVTQGMIASQNDFIGTVYYNQVSEVSSEVSGRVNEVFFETGQQVNEGQHLVSIDSELIKKDLQSTRADYEQVNTELEKAQADLKRTKELFLQNAISEKDYDKDRFLVLVLEKRANSLAAEVDRIETEIRKKIIKAPFTGTVVEKHTEKGAWLQQGSRVATIARTDVVDIIVNIPESILSFITSGMEVGFTVGSRELKGKVFSIIPKGNVETRTFPLKIRIEDNKWLMEGMEAKVTLPISSRETALIIPRDGIITQFGQPVVFSIENGTAKMHMVKIIGYDGLKAGISAPGLKQGEQVVIKGNERLREGQPVQIMPPKHASPQAPASAPAADSAGVKNIKD